MGRMWSRSSLGIAALVLDALACGRSELLNAKHAAGAGGSSPSPAKGTGGATGRIGGAGGQSGGADGGAGGSFGGSGGAGVAGGAGAGGNHAGGVPSSGGTIGVGGAAGTGGGSGAGTQGPCDIYAADGGKCAAAHSMVRALFATYNGNLYQVRRSDGALQDIPVDAPGGFAQSSLQDSFCGATACTISIIYDQSGNSNHLTKAAPSSSRSPVANEADAKALPITLSGHRAYGEHNPPGVGYRNNTPRGTAISDHAETMYMVTSGDYYNSGCCFDYGNAMTNVLDSREGNTEAIYFGVSTLGGQGAGSGPWVMADLGNHLWAGNTSPNDNNPSVTYKLVTAMLKGDEADNNRWTLKVGDAQSGGLATAFDGPRPSNAYRPMMKGGGIILGVAGDNSNAGQGNFFEGVMTSRYSSNAADDAVQANIVATYGR